MASDSSTLGAAERTRVRVRAQRHATALPLIIVGLSLLVLAWLDLRGPYMHWSSMFFGAVVLLVLYVTMLVRRLSTGLGSGRDGYGLVVIVAVGVVFVPMSVLLGPTFSLGLGLGILGWRGREPLLLESGLVVAVISPLAALGTIDNHADLLGPAPTAVVFAAAGLTLATMGVVALARERRTGRPQDR